MKFILASLFSLVSTMGFSQYLIDELIKNIPGKDESSIESLVAFINANANSEKEKVRGAYYWVANNIRYDAKSYFKDKRSFYRPHQVFREKLAVCEGYANLFQEICEQLHVQCAVVTGYSKGYGHHPRQTYSMADHAWNAFKLDSTWYLTDVTWASGYVQRGFLKRKFVKKFDDKYFNITPNELVIDHLPEVPMWQLSEYPVSLKTFCMDDEKIYAHFKKPTGNKFSFQDTLNDFFQLKNKLDSELTIGKMALRFNLANTTPMAYAKIDSAYRTFRLKSHLFADRSARQSLDQAILTTNQALNLFKAAKPDRKIQREYIKESVDYCYRMLNELHLKKAENEDNLPGLYSEKNFDTLLLSTKPHLATLEKALEVNEKVNNKMQRKWLLDQLCRVYSTSHERYKSFLENEKDKDKKRQIQKELNLLIQNAKKKIPVKCGCRKEVVQWK